MPETDSNVMDRRRDSVILNIVLPVIVNIFVGIGASYVGVQVTLAVTATKIDYLEQQLASLDALYERVGSMAVQNAKIGEWLASVDKTIASMQLTQRALIEQTRDRYTRSEADKDKDKLESKIDFLSREVRSIRREN